MNLRAIANRMTSTVNPNIAAVLRRSNGYSTGDDYKRVPAYSAPEDIIVQAQALSKKDVEHLDKLNISNAERAVYSNTQLTPVDRRDQTGGDLLEFEGATWLVVATLEGWTTAGWSKVAVAKQL